MVTLAQNSPGDRSARTLQGKTTTVMLALQLRFMGLSESMGDHDSKIVGAGSVD
jgi:hypothetical protein